jgi:hypothetical protein
MKHILCTRSARSDTSEAVPSPPPSSVAQPAPVSRGGSTVDNPVTTILVLPFILLSSEETVGPTPHEGRTLDVTSVFLRDRVGHKQERRDVFFR